MNYSLLWYAVMRHQSFSVGWDVEEEAKGHMVCCTYEELKAKIPFVPDLGDDVDLDTDITEP